jgi:KipI family sensor histidine kinase inhibitor
MKQNPLKFRTMGDRGLLVELGEGIDPAINLEVQKLALGLSSAGISGITELVPGYRSLMVVYHPLLINYNRLKQTVEGIHSGLGNVSLPPPKIYEIPVAYGGEYGPDLEWVADYHDIEPDDVIRLHTEPLYRVYMIGFTPGYPYMGELLEQLATPRRGTPRTHVPQGSVGIAQRQTGIYPVASPGGWQIIGRTPITLFDPAADPPARLEMGDCVRFRIISKEEMQQWPSKRS